MLLPGPPHELKAMFTRQCLPRLERSVPKQVIRTLVMRVAGMAESDLDQLISPVYKKYENPVTTILAAAGDIQVHLRARCATEAEAAGAAGGGGAGRSSCCWAIGSIRATATRWKWWWASCCASITPPGGRGELHRRDAGGADHLCAGQLRLFRGRLRHLHRRDEGRAAGRAAKRCWRSTARSARRRRRRWLSGARRRTGVDLRALDDRRRRARTAEAKRRRWGRCTSVWRTRTAAR